MIVGIAMMKDEADVCYWTVKHMMTQVDKVVVLDNNSNDETASWCEAAGATVIEDPDPAYYQSKKMSNLAKLVGEEFGATWVVPFDADEVWYAGRGPIKYVLQEIPSNEFIVPANLYNHYGTDKDDDTFINPFKRMGWRHKKPGALPKVACRVRDDLVIAQGNHGAIYDGEVGSSPKLLIVRHFPYRSPKQFIRKVVNGANAYKLATDLNEEAGAHWKKYYGILESEGEQALIHNVFYRWFYSQRPDEDPEYIYDPAPIQ